MWHQAGPRPHKHPSPTIERVVGSAIATPDELFSPRPAHRTRVGPHHERRQGRTRTIDIDIIQSKALASSISLTLPSARRERAFCSRSLAVRRQCRPEWRQGRVCDLLAVAPDREGIIDAVDDWLGSDPPPSCPDSATSPALEQASADMRELLENGEYLLTLAHHR